MSGNRRLASCVANWPEAEDGAYNPACCRFPKSCSPYPYAEQIAAGADLEPAVTAPELTAAEAARVTAIEAAPAAEEALVERMARALHKTDPAAWACGWPCSRSNHYRRQAATALAVVRGEVQ